MHSHARLTYNQVDAVQRGADPEGYAHIRRLGPVIENLYGVYKSLATARARRGALDLDLPEVKIELDESGSIVGVRSRLRNDAHRLIEECMIAANVEAARYLGRHRIATLYRVHNGPEGDKLEELRLLFQSLGVPMPDTARTRPREINRGLAAARDRPDFPDAGDGGVAQHDAGGLSAGKQRTLRPGAVCLCPFHLADSPLPRSARASGDRSSDRWWQAGCIQL